jgi:hypothetical protein
MCIIKQADSLYLKSIKIIVNYCNIILIAYNALFSINYSSIVVGSTKLHDCEPKYILVIRGSPSSEQPFTSLV